MPTWMTNGQAATFTAIALDNAFEDTQIWYAENPEATESQIIVLLDTNISSRMAEYGGTMTSIPPFFIPNPASYTTSLLGTGDCN